VYRTNYLSGLLKLQIIKSTPPSRFDMKQSMEALIHHFKFYTNGINVPASEIYMGTEAPKGEFGVYLISNNKINLIDVK
jgi:NADH-quinone oxidoreductase subunit D